MSESDSVMFVAPHMFPPAGLYCMTYYPQINLFFIEPNELATSNVVLKCFNVLPLPHFTCRDDQHMFSV